MRPILLAAALAVGVAVLPSDAPAGAYQTPEDKPFKERETRLPPPPDMHELDVEPVYELNARALEEDTGRHAVDGAGGAGDGISAVEGAWEARSGMDLRDVLEIWAEAAGWTLAWQSDHRYRLQASARFDGGFVSASGRLVEAFAKADPPIFAEFFKGNRVLVVTTPGAYAAE